MTSTTARVQPWLTMFSKGDVFRGKIVCVGSGSAEYQDKLLFPVCIREEKNGNPSTDPAEGDFHGLEVVPKGQQSQLKAFEGQVVSFVITSPGRGDQKPWVKLDKQKVSCPLDEVGKVVLATDCFKIASDLIVSGKAPGFTFEKIYQLSERIAENVLTLSKNL